MVHCFKEGEEETPVNDPSIEDLPEQSARSIFWGRLASLSHDMASSGFQRICIL